MRRPLPTKCITITTLLLSSLYGQAFAEKQLLWGDTHLHTYYSPDAYINQNFSLGPHEAYRFAKGLPIVHPTTQTRVQLQTPLDFLVVSDHAESLGVFRAAHQRNIPRDDLGVIDRAKAWLIERGMGYLVSNPASITYLLKYSTASTTDVVEAAKSPSYLPIPNTEMIQRNTWQETTEIADAHYQPGEFTPLIGWEWSAIPAGANLHRVVFTNSDAKVAQQYQPFSSAISNYPEDLWHWLEQTSAATGADFVAIPHNSNISRGFMFPAERRLRGEKFDSEWLSQRARWEPVVEATQVKGDSETHPLLSPTDSFADFESFPYYLKPGVAEYKPEQGDFIRSALRTGLSIEQQQGINPYRFGMIGSTDSHTGLATAEENNFWGKMAGNATPASKALDTSHIKKFGWSMSASGLAAVWSEDNSRDAILAAFQRREVYASTGPRIAVRLYAASDFGSDGIDSLPTETVTKIGTPMGGEIGPLTQAPQFIVYAMKDPVSAHLDRIQMVKGWVADGENHEKVYDIAWAGSDSGQRTVNATGEVPAVINTVNISDGTYSNEYGAASLSALWVDPDFDPQQSAFYYVRVLEIPTPRHSTLDAIALGWDPEETGQAISIQERAYTSPIWYTP